MRLQGDDAKYESWKKKEKEMRLQGDDTKYESWKKKEKEMRLQGDDTTDSITDRSGARNFPTGGDFRQGG